jgi:hypothetical protein
MAVLAWDVDLSSLPKRFNNLEGGKAEARCQQQLEFESRYGQGKYPM